MYAAGHIVHASDYVVHAAAVEGLGYVVIVVFLSLCFLCWHSETAAHSWCTWGMLSVWTCDHKAHDKMAFLCLCPLDSQEQLAAEGGLNQSD